MDDFPSPAHTSAILVLSAVSLAAAVIHASVAADHYEHYWGFGVFFVAVAVLQAVWGTATWIARDNWGILRSLLKYGILGNAVVAIVWLVSRLVGLPVGPDSWEAESVGTHDVLATLDELFIVAVGASLAWRARIVPLTVIQVTGLFLLVASLLSIVVAEHNHSGPDHTRLERSAPIL